jgi:hypothetical protein
MDDDKDKGIIEKSIEAVEEFASEVKDAAKHMMDPPEPLKPGDEVVMMPTADYGMFSTPPTPQFMVIHHPRKSRAKKAAKKTAKTAVKKTTHKSAKTTAKRSSKKTAAKKWNSPAKAPAKKTTGKKAVKKKKTKKSRR